MTEPRTADPPAERRLRSDLGFRRIALVLSGGGALGAYEVGVLRVLERIALVPSLVVGVSVGALNATTWVAHGGRTAVLESTWRELRAATIGIRWVTLVLRWTGAGLFLVAVLELVTTAAGSREISGAYWLWRKSSGRLDVLSTLLDLGAWLFAAGLGVATMLLSRPMEDWLARAGDRADPTRVRRWLGWTVVALAALYAAVWTFGWPWPHRFSAMLVLLLFLAWLLNRPDPSGHGVRAALFALMPETRGRGLWGSRARQRVIEALVQSGDPKRLVSGTPRLVVSAMAIDSGRICHFVTWPNPDPTFVRQVERDLGEVVVLHRPEDVIAATVASSAIPGVFEPLPVGGRSFVDPGGFANQPLHVALADGADAVLIVVMSASERPPSTLAPRNLVELGGRLLELANWRDLQNELRHLPAGWGRQGDPARVCVIEPDGLLPGGVLTFDRGVVAELIARGERDAWHALERAGWLVRDEAPAPHARPVT